MQVKETFITIEGLLLRQIKQIFLGGDSPALNFFDIDFRNS